MQTSVKKRFIAVLWTCAAFSVTAAPNLVLNSSIDKETLAPEFAIVEDPGSCKLTRFVEKNGNPVLKFELTKVRAKDNRRMVNVSFRIGGDKQGDGFPCKPDTVYNISFSMEGTINRCMGCFFEWDGLPTSWKNRKKIRIQQIHLMHPKDGWVTYKASFKTGPNAKRVAPGLCFWADAPSIQEKEGDYILVDNIVIEEAGKNTVTSPAPAPEKPQKALVNTPKTVEGNLVQNPSFEGTAPGVPPTGWQISKSDLSFLTVRDDIAHIVMPNEKEFNLRSSLITLNQKVPKPIRFGLTMKGETSPSDWRYGLILDSLEYQDGSKGGWSDTHFIFQNSSRTWLPQTTIFEPKKPIKSFRLLFLCSNATDLQIKYIFAKEIEPLRSTPNAGLNYDGSHPTNLVSNGNFEIVSKGTPKNWIPFFTTHPLYRQLPARINTAVDDKTRHSGDSSLLLSDSGQSIAGVENYIFSTIDSTRKFRLSGWVKADNATGMTFLEVLFYRCWLPMGFGSLTEHRNYGSYWNMIELAGSLRTPVTSGTHDWKELSVEGSAPAGANLVRFRIYSINNTGKVWVDDLFFDGFGIAPMEIVMNQSGFPENGEKRAFVRTSLPDAEGTFQLKQNGQTVYSGNLLLLGKGEWGRNNFAADFSKFRKEGIYTLEFKIGKESLESGPFSISKDFFRQFAEESRKMMFFQRCGYEVPGVHKACHLDDGQLRSKRDLTKGGKVTGHLDLSGGWHDAGDYDKYVACEVLPVITMLRLSERFNSPEFYDEASWGAAHIMKAVQPDGRIYWAVERTNRFGEIRMDQISPDKETDNIVGNEDDRLAIGPGYCIRTPLALTEYYLYAKDRNKSKAEEALRKAFLSRDAFMKNFRFNEKSAWFLHMPLVVQTECNFYKITGKKEYLDSARKYLKIILDNIERCNRTGDWKNVELDSHYYPYAALGVPMRFALAYPDDPLVPEIEKAVRGYIDLEILPSVKGTTFGILDARKKMEQGRTTNHTSIWQLGAASTMAVAAELFRDKNYLRDAERLYQYVFGVNPAGMSLVTGHGWKAMPIMSAASGIPGRTNGTVVPGAIYKGIRRGLGNAPHASAANLNNGFFYNNLDHPRGYPVSAVAHNMPLWGIDFGQELWEATNAVFMMATDDILSARKALNIP